MVRMTKPELIINDFLKENNFNFEPQYKFKDCKFVHALPFDFVVFNNDFTVKMAIEYDGIRHFKSIQRDNYKTLEQCVYRDKIKTEYCRDNNISLLRISYKYESKDQLEEILIKHLINNQPVINYSLECPKEIEIEPKDDFRTPDIFTDYNIDYITEIYLSGKLEDFLDEYDAEKNDFDYYPDDYEDDFEYLSLDDEPIKGFRRGTKLYKLNNQEKSLPQWCEFYNIGYMTVKQRLNFGWEFNKNLFDINFKRPRTKITKRSKLTEQDVKEIRKLSKEISAIKIAKKFNISESAIYNIINNKTWKWVE